MHNVDVIHAHTHSYEYPKNDNYHNNTMATEMPSVYAYKYATLPKH